MLYNTNLFPDEAIATGSVYKNKSMYNTFVYDNNIYEFIDDSVNQECFIDNNITYITCNFNIYKQFRNHLPLKYCPFQCLTHIDEISNNDTYNNSCITYNRISNKLLIYCKTKYNITDDITVLDHNAIDVVYNKAKKIYWFKESKAYNYTIHEFIDNLKLAIQSVCYPMDVYMLNSNFCQYIKTLCAWLGLSTKVDSNKFIIYNIQYMDTRKFDYICNGDSKYFMEYIIENKQISDDETFSGLMNKVYK